jgi:cell division septation protein DedD
VSDLTHDASDDGFHEIQLSGKQLVFLFMATTVVSVVIFLCGVLVGRGVRAERVAEVAESAMAGAPAPTDTVADAGPIAAEPPVPPAEAGDEAAAAPIPAPPVGSEKPTTEAAKPVSEQPKPPAEQPKRLSETAAPAPAAAPPTAEAVRGKGGRTPAASAPARGTWVVQLVALRDRGMASSIVQRLSGKGYPAFVVNPTGGTAAPVFKVQVGRYADRGEAEQVARRLEKEEQFKPWVSR